MSNAVAVASITLWSKWSQIVGEKMTCVVVTAGFMKTASLRKPIGQEQVTIKMHGYQQQEVDIIAYQTPPSPSHSTELQTILDRSMREADEDVLRELDSR